MESPQSDLNLAVIGVGAFGRNHARIYRELAQQGEPIHLAAIVDSDYPRAQAIAQEYGANAFAGVDDLLKSGLRINAASVAVPTASHTGVARSLMNAGIDVLVEKPLAPTLAEADELISLAAQSGRILQAGHLERFNPAVRATIPLITQPMFFEVHRLSVFTPRSLDVDVVLDLMIHDLDIVLSFVNSTVREVRAVGLPILSSRVDIANVRLQFENGCVANLTASRVSTERVRKLRFFQPHQYISVDYGRRDVLAFSVGSQQPEAQPSVNPQIGITRPPVDDQEPLHAELKSFLECVRQRSRPVVSGEDGRRALALALQIVDAIEHHSVQLRASEIMV